MVGSIKTSSATWMTGQIEGREMVMLLDTGSAVTLLSAHMWEAIKPAGDSKLHDASHGVVTADGSAPTLVGQYQPVNVACTCGVEIMEDICIPKQREMLIPVRLTRHKNISDGFCGLLEPESNAVGLL